MTVYKLKKIGGGYGHGHGVGYGSYREADSKNQSPSAAYDQTQVN